MDHKEKKGEACFVDEEKISEKHTSLVLAENIGNFCKLAIDAGVLKINYPEVGFWRDLKNPTLKYWGGGQYNDKNFQMIVQQYSHGMAVDDFLDNVKILYNKNVVYSANMHRSDMAIHKKQVFLNDTEWVEKMLESQGDFKKYTKV